jgi:hypothetical protein
MKKILTFKEYSEFNRVASNEEYSRNVSFYDPVKGWVLDLERKQELQDSEKS